MSRLLKNGLDTKQTAAKFKNVIEDAEDKIELKSAV